MTRQQRAHQTKLRKAIAGVPLFPAPKWGILLIVLLGCERQVDLEAAKRGAGEWVGEDGRVLGCFPAADGLPGPAPFYYCDVDPLLGFRVRLRCDPSCIEEAP